MKKPADISSLTKVAELVKISVAIIISVVTASWGAFKIMDDRRGEKEEIKKTLIEVTRAVDRLQVSQDSLIFTMGGFDNQLKEISINSQQIGNYVHGINKALEYHLKNSPEVTKEEYAMMIEMIEELKKKD